MLEKTTTAPAPAAALRCLVNLHAPQHLVVGVRTLMRDAIRDALHDGVETVCVDFANTTVVDSSGWGMLVGMRREAEGAGRRPILHNLSDDLLDFLRITRMDAVLLEGAP